MSGHKDEFRPTPDGGGGGYRRPKGGVPKVIIVGVLILAVLVAIGFAKGGI